MGLISTLPSTVAATLSAEGTTSSSIWRTDRGKHGLHISVGAEPCTAAEFKGSQKPFPEPVIHGHGVHYEGAGADQR